MRLNTPDILTAIIISFIVFFYIANALKIKKLALLAIGYFINYGIVSAFFAESFMVRKNAVNWLLESAILILVASRINYNILSKSEKVMRFVAERLNHFYLFLLAIVLSSIIYLFFDGSYGLIDAYSFESAMIILLLYCPVSTKYRGLDKLISFVLLAIAIFFSGATTMAMLFCVVIYFFDTKKELRYGLATIAIAGVFAAYYFGYIKLDDSGRFQMWAEYLKYWQQNYNMIIGSGIGTFKQISPHVPINGQTFLYAHNDFLQVFLETGFIGLFMFLYLIGSVVIRAFKARNLYASIAMIIFMFNYFPSQILLTKLIIVLFVCTINLINVVNRDEDAAP